jgi:hypothetical protein
VARAVSAKHVAETFTAAQRQEKEKLASLQKWWKEELAKAEAEYLADTGEPMPANVNKMKAAAVKAGFTAGEAMAGKFTLADIYDMTVATIDVEKRQAAAIVDAMRAADTAALVDKYQRAADGMSSAGRKVVRVMLDYNATREIDAMTRSGIVDATSLPESQVKNVMETEIPRVAAALGARLHDSKPSHGTWLTPEGVEVAKRISQKILS